MPYAGDPSANPIDAVRFWLGDTSVTPLLSDDEIRFVIEADADYTGGDARLVAAACADQLISKYTGRTTIIADGVTYSPGELADKYATLAKSLRAAFARAQGPGSPTAGALTENPLFSIGMHDHPDGYGPYSLGQEDRWDPANYQIGGG